MTSRLLVLFVLVLAHAESVSGGPTGGTIRGRIQTIANGKPVAPPSDVYVYLEPVRRARHGRALPGAGKTASIRQQGKDFAPHVTVVPVGTAVYFPNYDPDEHNVFSPTDPPGQWDLGRYKTDHKGKSHAFDDAGEYDIYCDIHKDMWAKVKVVESPYIAVAKPSGEFVFDNVEPGTYRVVGWLVNNKDEARSLQPLTINKPGDAAQLPSDLHLQLQVVAPKAHVRKDGNTYSVYPKP